MNIRRIDICVLLLSALIPASSAWSQDDDLLHIESEEVTYDWVVCRQRQTAITESAQSPATPTARGVACGNPRVAMGRQAQTFNIVAEHPLDHIASPAGGRILTCRLCVDVCYTWIRLGLPRQFHWVCFAYHSMGRICASQRAANSG